MATVNSILPFKLTVKRATQRRQGLALVLIAFLPVFSLLTTSAVSAAAAADVNVLRVDVPLQDAQVRNGELQIGALITNNTYIDIQDFNLRAIELEASSTGDGEVRLKIGRYVTPPVPLPGPDNQGLLRIEAPHKSNKSWRLLIEDRVSITSLTAVLEPRDNRVDYTSRYERRGYTLGQDDNYRPFLSSRNDAWPYSWLGNNYDNNRRSAHWFWLNNPRASSFINSGYGSSHQHRDRCYDRFGRHLSFNSSFNRPFSPNFNRGSSRRFPVTRNQRISNSEATARAETSVTDAQRNQAAQSALQQQAQQQAQARQQEQIRAQQIREQRQRQQQRREAFERRSSRSLGSAAERSNSDRRRAQQQRRVERQRVDQRRAQQRRSQQDR